MAQENFLLDAIIKGNNSEKGIVELLKEAGGSL